MATTLTSFSNTPQAVDDYYYGYNEDWIALIYFDVMANDLGGKAKTLYSLDDGTTTTDLLTADTARAESMSNDYSKYGAKIWITSDGKVGYDVNTSAFQDTIQSLADGEHLTDIFTYAIRLGNGALSWATTYVDFVGLNDAPVVISGGFSGTVTEQIAPAGDLEANGLINFKDVDLSDSHTISFAPVGSVLGSLEIHLIQDTNGSGNSLNGQVSWAYKIPASTVEYLAAGESRIEQFNVSINDGHDGIVVQQISVTIVGTNDAPTLSVASSDFSGQVTEMVTPVGILSDAGVIHFGDVDLSDVHSVSVSATDSNPRLGALVAVISLDSTGSGSGQVSWTYQVLASHPEVEALAAGELRVESFDVAIMDNHGAMVSKQVDITIIGTNDAPIINSNGGGEAAAISIPENSSAVTVVSASDVYPRYFKMRSPIFENCH
jgi:VCBS repeat-containing protein